VVEDFQEYSDFRAYEDSTEVAKKKKTKQKRKTGNKTTDWKFDFQRAKEYQKNRKEIKDLEVQKLHSIVHGRKSTG
jgi:ATP-binding cassette subfamily F protein uup